MFLLRDGSHGAELALGTLLGTGAGLALLAGKGAAALLLAHDAADKLSLHGGTLALHLEELGVGDDVGRRGGARRRGASGAGDGAGVVVEGVAEEEVVVGEIRRRALLAVRLGQRRPSRPRGKGAGGVVGAEAAGGNVHGRRSSTHGAV